MVVDLLIALATVGVTLNCFSVTMSLLGTRRLMQPRPQQATEFDMGVVAPRVFACVFPVLAWGGVWAGKHGE